MRVKNTTTFNVWSFPNSRTTPPNKWGNKNSVVTIICCIFLREIVGDKYKGVGEIIVLIMDEELHDVVVVVTHVHFSKSKFCDHDTRVHADLEKMISVTVYSNSIRDNILLANLLFEWVK